nr:hypothetical protein [Tanacetum cinerariifolium]
MQKLHSEGLLENIDEESFDKCESCISGKMTKKPFNKNIERATDLLGLIHTDMCGPLRHVLRKCASYFLTFTDDFSRYGYVFLLKHKHEVDKTPYEIWHGKAPNLSYLKVWGCEAYVKRDSADKLQQRFVKYGDFLKRDLISQKFSGRDYDLEDDHMDTLPSENTSEIPVEPKSLGPPSELIPVRRSERTTRAPNRLCLNMKVKDDEVMDLGEPANYKTVMLDPDKVIWQGAMDEEIKSIKVNKVWIVVDRPPNAKETFSPVADIRAIRIIIAIAAYYDYEIWQMDVKNAFLNGRLDEDIYMEQPEGYVDPKYPNGVCKLQRAIYGLKQASRQ